MLTNLTIRNFKRFGEVEVELGSPVVFIGPNNSGKTTALQALALWSVGLNRWNEKRSGEKAPEKRPGVTINRRDLTAMPVPNAKLLWNGLHVRQAEASSRKPKTKNVRIEIVAEGVTADKRWTCGLEFDYANEESFYCRPLRVGSGKNPERMEIPPEAADIKVAFLPPMSGLAAIETRQDRGALDVRIGEGRTAEVLRNLCYLVVQRGFFSQKGEKGDWVQLSKQINQLFGVQLEEPRLVAERGEITMSYRERSGTSLDLSCAGRGLQQTLLLLAYLYVNPESMLLLDEPDAHLEILRQRQTYQLLTDVARRQGCQLIAASHSEVLFNEAAGKDVVVAFVGKPHRIDRRGSQVLKSLKKIGFDQYYLAEQRGWVLYLEGSTDLDILRAFARTLEHRALECLERPFVHYVSNERKVAHSHFFGLREAKPDLVGFALFDRLDKPPEHTPHLSEHQWHRREIENYLCQPETVLAYVEQTSREASAGDLFAQTEVPQACNTMQECIRDLVSPAALRDRSDKWWLEMKASDDFLDRVFAAYYVRLKLPNLTSKKSYYELAEFVPREVIDDEITHVLDQIVTCADSAKPLAEE